MMEFFAEIVNSWKPLTIFAKKNQMYNWVLNTSDFFKSQSSEIRQNRQSENLENMLSVVSKGKDLWIFIDN